MRHIVYVIDTPTRSVTWSFLSACYLSIILLSTKMISSSWVTRWFGSTVH